MAVKSREKDKLQNLEKIASKSNKRKKSVMRISRINKWSAKSLMKRRSSNSLRMMRMPPRKRENFKRRKT